MKILLKNIVIALALFAISSVAYAVPVNMPKSVTVRIDNETHKVLDINGLLYTPSLDGYLSTKGPENSNLKPSSSYAFTVSVKPVFSNPHLPMTQGVFDLDLLSAPGRHVNLPMEAFYNSTSDNGIQFTGEPGSYPDSGYCFKPEKISSSLMVVRIFPAGSACNAAFSK